MLNILLRLRKFLHKILQEWYDYKYRKEYVSLSGISEVLVSI